MKNSFCSGSRGSSSNSPNELAPQFLAATFSLHPFFLSSSLCLYNAGSVCVCVWARAFVCSCLEDMHKNALHFRFSLMRVCWWALFSALVFRKQWFPISSKPLPPPKSFPIRTPSKAKPPPLPTRHPFGRQKWNCSEFILCFEQSFVAYFKAVLPAAVMYVLTERKKNTNKNNQLRFVVEKLQNYAKVRRPPPP